MAAELIGFPRHLSQHVGGFIITNERLDKMVPIGNAAMADRTVEWDKDDLDALGMLKIDVLALGMLSAIRRSFDLIAAHHGKNFELAIVRRRQQCLRHAVSCRGNGVSGGKPRANEHVAAFETARFLRSGYEVAIVRPGPIQGDMVHPYLRRRNGERQ